MKRRRRIHSPQKWFNKACLAGVVFAALLFAWFTNALTFDFFRAEQDSTGNYVLSGIDPKMESEVIAGEALKGGVIWIDSLVIYEGLGFAFCPYGQVAIMTLGSFPRWHILSTAWHGGDRSEFDFAGNARKAKKNLLHSA